MTLKVIAYAHNGHTDKFGIPRQSREESPILTRIVFEPEYHIAEALRGIEGYSHLWLLWGFNTTDWNPTVRPPRLGGNTRMGVFATRSPYRPNPIGLSSVRFVAIENGDLIVSGADVLDGTPIYDIKPYLSFSDCHEEAKNGFAEEHKNDRIQVRWDLISRDWTENGPILDRSRTDEVSEEWVRDVEYILSQDPRPGYQDDPDREYKLDYGGYTLTFVVKEQTVVIKRIEKTCKS